MTETNDYEKAKEDCWRDWTYEEPAEMSLHEFGEARKVFDYAFDRAYQLGKEHAQPANGLVNELVNERLQVAAMAMQGLLASGMKKGVVKRAIELTDSLLTELNKEDNDTNSNK